MDEVRYQQDGKGLGETYFYITLSYCRYKNRQINGEHSVSYQELHRFNTLVDMNNSPHYC